MAQDQTGSNCRLCTAGDAVLMLECEQCTDLYHFPCVGVDTSVTKWVCQRCVKQSTIAGNTSNHPSTSSRHHSPTNTDTQDISAQTIHSSPRTIEDSTVLDPNASSCQMCDEKDTLEMAECELCKGWYHFKCVGIDMSVALNTWTCPKCPTPAKRMGNKSVRSSTSSKRRSALQLEKLAKEKAIQHKLIEEKAKLAQHQATVDSEFLRKEYEILENMSESEEDDMPSSVQHESGQAVTDWLKTSIPQVQETKLDQSRPSLSIRDIIRQLDARNNQTMIDVCNKTPTIDAKFPEDLVLIPPKLVQFAQPLTDELTNKSVHEMYPTLTDLVQQPIKPVTSPYQVAHSGCVVNQTNSETNLESFDEFLNRAVRNTTFDHNSRQVEDVRQSSVPIQSVPTADSNFITQQMTAQPMTSTLFTSEPNLSQQSTFVPVSAQQQQSSSISYHQPSNLYQQSTYVPISAQQRQPSSVPYQPIPASVQQHGLSSNMQQPTATFNIPQVVPTPIVQPPQFSTSNHQQFIPNSTHQQTVPPSSMQQQFQQFVSSSGQPSFVQNTAQQSMFGSNQIPQPTIQFGPQIGSNIGTAFNPSSPNTTSQWTNYDPQLNSQQLPPTRLQLAARQTMPKDYPKFNGDPEKWSIFHNAYVNGTTTCGLSNGENLSRLERCLEDPARKAVQNLLTRPEAVPDIIETLKMLYGRPEASIDSQLKVIRNEPPPKMNKMETFIDFAMSVRNVTSEIEKTGMWQYLWNPQLLQELVDKLPYQMRMDWGQIKMSTPTANLSNFSEWLFWRARTACAVTLPSNTDKKSNSNGHVNAHSKSDNSGKKGSNDVPKRSTNSNQIACLGCKGKSHDIYECRKFLGMSLNDRWETVKQNKLCRICLGLHHVLRCESKLLCGESGCTIKHHRLLHNPTKIVSNAKTTGNNASSNEGVHSAHQQSEVVILRRYIPVTLFGPKGSLNVVAFLDEGSDMTLVENQIVQKLGIIGTPTDLFLEWTAKIVRKEPNSKSIKIKISGTQTQQKQYEIKDARTVKSLDLPPQTINIDQLRNAYKFLRRIPIESYTDETPKILIGLRDCKLSTPLTTRSGEWDEPIAAKTLLGWEVHGSNTPSAQIVRLNFHASNEMNDDDKLHQMVAQFFSLENFGVKKLEQTVEAVSDKRARQLLEKTTKRIGNKFETGLLWKYDDVSLPDSLPMAKRRLISLEKRLQRDPELASKFRSKFRDYVDKGYVRKLTEEEIAETNHKTWYLPLFPVTYAKKPGKIRLVWDAAAKVTNISLNSMLLSGPDLLVSLQGVLYRFRQGAYVVTGDIREMFHQVDIRKEDQMSQRFLWREEDSSKIDVYVLQVMSFGATCSPSSAQYVKNYNAFQFVEKYPKAEVAIRTNTYVDDWLQAFDTETEAEFVANEVKEVYSLGGFEIRNWLSNSPQVSRNLGESCDGEQQLCIGADESQTERVLGMWWNVKRDAFTYSLRFNPLNKDILFNTRRPTKREALRTLMSIYDPLGFLAVYLVQLKMILQDIWRIGLGWDQQIKEKDDDGLHERWLNWIKHLPEIERVRINRHYSDKINSVNPTKIELHIFVDAGEPAYATVAYFRIEDKDSVDVSLIGGKTKVAPLKPLSVPRMELQAAVLGARFKNSILENHTLKIARTVIWSDSSTVLSWLRSDLRKYNQYVGARVGEILETTMLSEWRWVPSKLNPADDATKDKSSFNLDMNSRWFAGPDFLKRSEEFWPTPEDNLEETKEELRPKYVHAHIKVEVENLPIKFENALQWKRTMAFVLRFINNVKAKLGKPGYVAQYGDLTRKEFQEGTNALYRKAQLDEFGPEIRRLQHEPLDSKGRRPSVEKTSSIYRYSPYLDCAGLLRMRGRIDFVSNISLDQKRPIILPKKHQITDVVVKEYHNMYKHRNTETVINEIKQKFIIPRLRAVHKRIRRECQHCKNAAAQPLPPEMAQLPFARLASFTRPFTFVGVDYAGPYTITQFRRSVKRWIVVFTCLTIRGVYIDCVESLTTDSCIMAINRFIARNGTPREFFSDRGTNFIGANNELLREVAKIDHDLLNVKFTTCYTQWNFNPPYAQYMGGAWERLIGSMKITLDKILPKSHYPNHETFVTALTEVENIINSRPLTFVSIESDDPEALTPNHFIKGSSNGNKPPGIFPPPPSTLRGNWRYAQQIANEFWNKWVKEYLPMITRRTKWFDDVKPIEVGDQVIIVDENAPRNMWDRGVVIETINTGRNGRISQVKVRTTNGIYTRAVSKLAVLDLGKERSDTQPSESPSNIPENFTNSRLGPVTKLAAESKAKTLTRESLAGGSVAASSDE